MTTQLPYVGAAMPTDKLESYRDWLIENQRDLEIQDFISPFVLDNSTERDGKIQLIKSMLDGYSGRLGIHAPFWNVPMAAMDPKIRAVVQERFTQALDVCAEIGATHMVVHSPLMFLGAPDSISKPMMGRITLFELIHDTMEDMVKQAESIQCTLVIENIFDKYPLLLTDLVKSFDSQFVRQSLDTGHAYINYVEGAPPPDYYVREAGSLLAHLHLQDTDGYSDRHWSIGDGKIDWKSLFDEIAIQGANPRLILELKNNDDILDATQWLNDRGLAQ